MTLPPFARSFIVDFVETAVTAVFALNIIIPGDLGAAKAQALIVGSAVAGAFVSAARRALPGAIAWLREKLRVEPV